MEYIIIAMFAVRASELHTLSSIILQYITKCTLNDQVRIRSPAHSSRLSHIHIQTVVDCHWPA